MLGGFSHCEQAPLLDISGYIICSSHVLYFAEHQFAEWKKCLGRILSEEYI